MKKFILLLVMLPILAFAQTKNIVPRADGEGSIGTFAKAWLSIHADSIYILGGSIQDLISDSVSNETVSMDRIQEVVDYEPAIQDSSILLYNGGVWSIFDLGATLAGIVAGTPTLPDSIVYTSEIVNLVTKSALADSNFALSSEIPDTTYLRADINAIPIVSIGYPDANTIDIASGQSIVLDPSTLEISGGTLTVIGGTGTDSGAVIDLALAEIQTWADTAGYESAYDGNAIDSLLALAGTSLQTVTFPDANTIEFKTGVAIQLDPVTLEINGSDQLTVIGGTGFDSTYAYQRITALEDSIGSLRYTLNAILGVLDSLGYAPDLSDNTPPDAPTSFVAIGGTATGQFVSTWTDPTATDLDSIRFYAGSSNDSTSLVWIESIAAGVETFSYRDLSPNTTYWCAVKAIDDSGNVSYFSNIDSATTLPSGGGGFTPDSLNPVLYLVHNSGVTADANGKITAWTDGTYNFTVGDTAFALTQTDSSIFCDSSTVGRRLTLNDAVGNPFDIGTGDMSVEIWMWNTTGGLGNIFQKDGVWGLQIVAADGQNIQFQAVNGAYTIEAQVRTDAYTKDAWHHFVFSWDRNGDAILFIDSVASYATDVDFDNLSATDLNSTDPSYIYGLGGTDQPLGHIAVIRFYNYALTPTQVKQLYEYGKE